jgi:fibronectin type 3 domain-containing protein
MKKTSLAALTLLFISGCNNLNNNLNTPISPKIDESIQMVDNESIKSISEITSIAFEWQKVDDPKVVGYNFYRANMHKDGRTLKLVKSLNNRYATHYVDTNLEPDTKYVYQISSRTENGVESKSTNAYMAQTLPRITPVSFVQALSDLPNRIKILWRPHTDKRIEYYKVEKFNTTLNQWITLETIKNRLQAEYIDTKLGNSESYKYRITAYTFNDIESLPSDAVIAKTKALPIGAQNLTATGTFPKKINLTWEPSPTPDVIKYAIYRSPFKSIGYSKEKEVNANVGSYIDTVNEDGKEYFYKVIAIDKDGLLSTEKIDEVKGTTLGKPAKPIITLAQIQGNKAIINWDAGDSRAISYNIYKRIKLNFFEYKMVKVTDVRDLRFEDTDIIGGVEYKYSIQANDEYGLMSDKTDEASLILPQTKILK